MRTMDPRVLIDEQHLLPAASHPIIDYDDLVLDFSDFVVNGNLKIGNDCGCVTLDDRSFDRLVALVTAKRKTRENVKRHAAGLVRYEALERRADALRLRFIAHGWDFIGSQGVAPEALADPDGKYIEIEHDQSAPDEDIAILDEVEKVADRLDAELAR